MRRIFWIAPWVVVLALIPTLTAPIPVWSSVAREVAHYYHAVAILDHGLQSYNIVTLRESYGGIHVYSLLTTPLVAIGYIEGGRLVNLLLGIGAVGVTTQIAASIYNWRVATLVPIVMAGNAYFRRFAYILTPDMLSIFLTVSAVYAGLYRSGRRWFYVSLALVGLAVLNHSWEATIMLPLVAGYLSRLEYTKALSTTTVGLLSLFTVQAVVSLQPQKASLGYYAITTAGPSPLLSAEWWRLGIRLKPFSLMESLMLWLGILVILVHGVMWVQRRKERDLILATWALSALAIPVLLPRGHTIHNYYLWAFVVPVTVSAAWIGTQLAEQITPPTIDVEVAKAGLVLVLALSSAVAAASYDAGLLHQTSAPILDHRGTVQPPDHPDRDVNPGQPLTAASEIRETGVENANDLVFVGYDIDNFTSYDITRTLIYSGVDYRGPRQIQQISSNTERGPDFVENTSKAEDCQTRVIAHDDGQVSVERCS